MFTFKTWIGIGPFSWFVGPVGHLFYLAVEYFVSLLEISFASLCHFLIFRPNIFQVSELLGLC
jgi:hypothetical protein